MGQPPRVRAGKTEGSPYAGWTPPRVLGPRIVPAVAAGQALNTRVRRVHQPRVFGRAFPLEALAIRAARQYLAPPQLIRPKAKFDCGP